MAYEISIWLLPVLIAVTFHEAAHGFVAHLLGDDTAWWLGRVSFNPWKHVDPVGTILLPAMLLLMHSPFLFGYAKPVPVNFRALRNPPPIQVRWATTDSTEGRIPGIGAAHPRASSRMSGTLRDITHKFLELPGRQLFIIGVPGSGKTATALLFTLSLLRLWAEGEPVPVLLSPVGWDPQTRSFQEWMGDEILANYPALSETGRYGERAAHHLVATGRILPVIDGLDEISESLSLNPPFNWGFV